MATHSEADRPEVEKVNNRFKKKMIGFGRPDEIKKIALAGDPFTPHQKMFQINEISIEIDEIAIKINEITTKNAEM